MRRFLVVAGHYSTTAVSSLTFPLSGRKGYRKLHTTRISRCVRGGGVSARHDWEVKTGEIFVSLRGGSTRT